MNQVVEEINARSYGDKVCGLFIPQDEMGEIEIVNFSAKTGESALYKDIQKLIGGSESPYYLPDNLVMFMMEDIYNYPKQLNPNTIATYLFWKPWNLNNKPKVPQIQALYGNAVLLANTKKATMLKKHIDKYKIIDREECFEWCVETQEKALIASGYQKVSD
jgi:hypothetical protein